MKKFHTNHIPLKYHNTYTFTLYCQQSSDLIKALNLTITIFGDSSGINILSTILSRPCLSALSLNALLSSLVSFQSPELLAYK